MADDVLLIVYQLINPVHELQLEFLTYPGGIWMPRNLIKSIYALAELPLCVFGTAWSLSLQYGQLSESSNHFLIQ